MAQKPRSAISLRDHRSGNWLQRMEEAGKSTKAKKGAPESVLHVPQ